MPLTKLKVRTFKHYEEAKIDGDGTSDNFDVLFNPGEYTVEDGSNWKEQESTDPSPELQYTGGNRKVLNTEFFLDTREQHKDVREYTSKFAKMLVPSVPISDGKRPPIVRLEWGPKDPDAQAGVFPFVCVLEKLTQKFTLFEGDGTPVRATLTVSFKEFSLPEDELKKNPRRNSFPAEIYTVVDGDTLQGIAAKRWRNAANWRRIAAANEILNPRIISPGQELIIPTIQDEESDSHGRSGV